MNIFITGGTGLLGSNLVAKLAQNNEVEKIVCLVRDVDKGTLLHEYVPNNEKLEIYIGNLTDTRYELNDIDFVIHSASMRNISFCDQNSAQAIDMNVEGTRRLLEAVKEYKVKKFIYISSQSVYGNQNKMPMTEQMLCNPIGVYSLTKYIGEILTRNILHDVSNYIILRCSRLYGTGPFMNQDNFITSKYPKACLLGEDLLVTDDGSQSFDIINVKDAVNCIQHLLATKEDAWNECYNLGSGVPVSIVEIAKTFSEYSKSCGFPGSQIKHVVNRLDDQRKMWLDITKIKQKTGWKPTVTLKNGITEILAFYK